MIGVPVGILYANASEWVIHKYVLHGLGRRKSSFWSFHWHEHHRQVRRNDHLDPDYQRSLWGWNAQSKEALTLTLAVAAHLPLLPVAPFFTATLAASALNYYRVHKRSHVDPDWGREHLRWHWDHHMGPDQNANWCVTWPLMDYIMGTRKPYAGTERERQDQQRRQARHEARAQAA